MSDAFLNPEQAAKILNLSAYTVRHYARQGLIPAYRVGRVWRFSRDRLLDWLEERRRPQVSEPASHAIARDSLPGGETDVATYYLKSDKAPVGGNERQHAAETLLAIRARIGRCDVCELVRESRDELLRRGIDEGKPQ